MGEIIVKPAQKEDLGAIKSLIHVVHINPFGLDWHHFLLAFDESEEMLGCGQIKVHSDHSRELASIAVKESFRNKGVARKIISELVRQESTRPLYLTCRATLKNFYNKFGFQVIMPEEMPRYFRLVHWIAGFLKKDKDPQRNLLVMRLD